MLLKKVLNENKPKLLAESERYIFDSKQADLICKTYR